MSSSKKAPPKRKKIPSEVTCVTSGVTAGGHSIRISNKKSMYIGINAQNIYALWLWLQKLLSELIKISIDKISSKWRVLISNLGWIKTSNKFRRGHFLVFPKTYVLKCMF